MLPLKVKCHRSLPFIFQIKLNFGISKGSVESRKPNKRQEERKRRKSEARPCSWMSVTPRLCFWGIGEHLRWLFLKPLQLQRRWGQPEHSVPFLRGPVWWLIPFIISHEIERWWPSLESKVWLGDWSHYWTEKSSHTQGSETPHSSESLTAL